MFLSSIIFFLLVSISNPLFLLKFEKRVNPSDITGTQKLFVQLASYLIGNIPGGLKLSENFNL